MKNIRLLSTTVFVFLFFSSAQVVTAQSETNRAVADGGVSVDGWQGKIDARAASKGEKITDTKFTKEGDGFHIVTGPAASYWNPKNTASGDYTVSATYNEAHYMNLNNHPHPYGIFIGGNGMETDKPTYLYCAVYGNGSFIVRGFGPDAFQMNGRRPESNDAIHKASGKGAPVTQKISMSVRGGKVECAVNGTVVASYDKSAVVGDGKLASTDGIFGIRFAHNTEASVTNFHVEQH